MSSPIPAAYRLAPGHRTIDRTGLTRQRFRRSCCPPGGAPACPMIDPLTDTVPDHVSLSPAPSIQIFPSPRSSWAAVSLPAELEPILVALLLAEELEQACPRQPLGQRGGLLVRARRPQAGQQRGHAARVVEGDVGGGITAQQRGGL